VDNYPVTLLTCSWLWSLSGTFLPSLRGQRSRAI